jgi:cytochrome c oxidase cbb3-type subunit IV
MDINDFRTLATVLVAIAFAGVVFWAYGPSRKSYFDEAAQLPFNDEVEAGKTTDVKGKQSKGEQP